MSNATRGNASSMGPTYNNNKMAAPSVTKARQGSEVDSEAVENFVSRQSENPRSVGSPFLKSLKNKEGRSSA